MGVKSNSLTPTPVAWRLVPWYGKKRTAMASGQAASVATVERSHPEYNCAGTAEIAEVQAEPAEVSKKGRRILTFLEAARHG